MKEGPVVIARGQGTVHFFQPDTGLVGRDGAQRQRNEQQADHGAGSEPRPNWQPTTRHGATRASGGRLAVSPFADGWGMAASLTGRPPTAAAAAAAPASSASAPASRSFKTSFCPRTEEDLLWANT